MIVVIQCAARKNPCAGYLRTVKGKNVLFVADVDRAPSSEAVIYARPDDFAPGGETWRQELLRYNSEPKENPLDLLPAWRLYENPTYQTMVERFGLDHVFILSAGWGLISADFLTPAYDITFSASTARYKRRRKSDRYQDLMMIDGEAVEPIVFFGGKDYVPLFSRLTQHISAPRKVFFNSAVAPNAPGCDLKRFDTRTRTNWHYECANAFARGEVWV